MKRLLSFMLIVTLLFPTLAGCTSVKPNQTNPGVHTNENSVSSSDLQPAQANESVDWNQEVKFTGFSDPSLLPYIEDTVYRQLVLDIDSSDYFIEDVSAVFVSQEYLDELAYNSLSNVFFGYTLAELDTYFEGTRYVFTLGEDGKTVVKELQEVEDTTYDQLIKNVAIGTGVILVCVTVSVATAGIGTAPAVSMIFAVAAKTAATCALSGALISGVTSAAVRGYQTGDVKEAFKAGALGASQGYMWGAISGALAGGSSEALGLFKATTNGLTMNEAALIQKESGYPLNVIKEFHSVKEYEVFKNAQLTPQMINGKLALTRTDIDLNQLDEFGKTNLQRMLEGKPPLDSTNTAFELHHIGQKNDGTLAILTQAEHDNAALHGFISESEIDRVAFRPIREAFWKTMAHILSGGA